jgi:hypothetical protein
MIYPPELEIKETTDTASSASFLDLYLEIRSNKNPCIEEDNAMYVLLVRSETI